jgi:polyferredoxin
MVPNYYQNHNRQNHSGSSQPGAFKDLDATELYCPRCKTAVPVRKRLLLVLPEGDKYEYVCAYCAETVGSKIDRQQKTSLIL